MDVLNNPPYKHQNRVIALPSHTYDLLTMRCAMALLHYIEKACPI